MFYSVMNISFPKINNVFSTKAVYKNASVPVFKGQLDKDIFVRTTTFASKTSENSQLPEYLYHLTNKSNYERIVDSAKMKPSEDIIDGVFMFDMKDFQTNWRNTKDKSEGTLAKGLLQQAIKWDNDLVLLRIPTKTLDASKFRIRPQDDVIEFINSDKYRNLHMAYAESGGPYKHKYEFPKDLVEGYPVSDASKFFDANRAVEYIYQGSIDINSADVQKVYEIHGLNSSSIKNSDTDKLNEFFDDFQRVED